MCVGSASRRARQVASRGVIATAKHISLLVTDGKGLHTHQCPSQGRGPGSPGFGAAQCLRDWCRPRHCTCQPPWPRLRSPPPGSERRANPRVSIVIWRCGMARGASVDEEGTGGQSRLRLPRRRSRPPPTSLQSRWWRNGHTGCRPCTTRPRDTMDQRQCTAAAVVAVRWHTGWSSRVGQRGAALFVWEPCTHPSQYSSTPGTATNSSRFTKPL